MPSEMLPKITKKTKVEIEAGIRPVMWEVLPPMSFKRGYFYGIRIEEMSSRGGETVYRVTSAGLEMNHQGVFSYPRLPSSRSERSYKAHRWSSFEEAKEAAIKGAARCLRKFEKEDRGDE